MAPKDRAVVSGSDAGGRAGRAEHVDVEVLVVGAGFSGLAVGHYLRGAGIASFRILEKADEVGGTWRENHYPGAACDVPSHLYSFSFSPDPGWSRSYSPQPEILQYLRDVARREDLVSHIVFGAEVLEARFDEARGTDFVPVAAAEVLESLKVEGASQVTQGRFLRLWPHRHQTDGFFAAVWQRR